jgi:class 3 adenylate cyclase
MPELPTGTVTLLFTDIEGSTRLLHEFGERYADVLAEHRRVLIRRSPGERVVYQGAGRTFTDPRSPERSIATWS